MELQTPPNAAFSNSNEGYVTLGVIVETVSGIRLEDYLQSHIFDPVGMKRTYSRFSQWRATTDRSHGYAKNAEDYRETQLLADYSISLSTGGICSTAIDFANYLIATMDYANSPLLSAGSLAAMHTVSMPYGDTGWGYGFGWYITWNAGQKVLLHDGGLPGIATYALMVPAEQLGVVVLTNLLNKAGARRIVEELASSVLRVPVLRPTFEDPLPFNTRYPLPDADTFAQYVGTYTRVNRENREDQISVEMGRGKLTLRYPYDEVTSYLPIGPDIFMDPRWSIIIRFGRDPGGDVNNLLQRGLLFQRRR